MRITSHLKRAVLSLDEMLASLCLLATSEQGSLLIFLFHGLFRNRDEIATGVMDPQQGITVDMLSTFIRHFRLQGYHFVSPDDLLDRPALDEKCCLITFDDGYYNNVRALPVLEEFDVPAVFFISTDHVKYEKAFWWDVVYRESKKRRWTSGQIRKALTCYKLLKTSDVESDLRQRFGNSALQPVGDLDRPFSSSEIRSFASHRFVFLGNHTRDHAVLTNYSEAEVSEQISAGQDSILRMTGTMPKIIAYPNGNESFSIRSIAWKLGLRTGVGAWPGKNSLPLKIDAGGAMTMRRFTLWGDTGIDPQCRISRSGLSLYRSFKWLTAEFHPATSPVTRSA